MVSKQIAINYSDQKKWVYILHCISWEIFQFFFWHLVSDLQLRNSQLHVVIGQLPSIIACTILLGILSAP